MPYYIGIANTCHDPALAVVSPEGELIFAEALERYFQQKRAWDLPPDHWGRLLEVIRSYCDPEKGFVAATSWKTSGLLGKQFETGDMTTQAGGSEWNPGERAPNSLFRACDGQWLLWSQKRAYDGCGGHLFYLLANYFGCRDVRFRRYDHHLAHAAEACFTSPFDRALCLIADGEGEIGSVSCFFYSGGKLKPVGRSWGPGSPGRFYAKITELCGFDWRKGEEGKVMGLAAYGRQNDALVRDLKALVRPNGWQLVQAGESDLADVFGRMGDGATFSREDIAGAGQKVFEQIMEGLLEALYDRGGSENLVLGGGCALNSSFNGKISRNTRFKNVHVPCAPGDDGNAAGAAFLAFLEDHPEHYSDGVKYPDSWSSPYLGSKMDSEVLTRALHSFPPGMVSRHPGTIHFKAAELLSQGNILGWIQGRAEYGPRSLGNRSILADPRLENMKDRLNREVKFRETFRPFAPAILASEADGWFHYCLKSPYMSFTLPWREERIGKAPAVVHKDGTGRLQTVDDKLNPDFYNLLTAFDRFSGMPLLLNTSLNIMGKPIVHSLEDVIGIFFTTGMDALAVGDYLIRKKY